MFNRKERRYAASQALSRSSAKAAQIIEAAQSATMLKTLRRRAFWMGFGDGFATGCFGAVCVLALLVHGGIL